MKKSKFLSLLMAVMLVFSSVFIGTASPVQAATAKSGKVAVTVPKTTLCVGDSKNNSTPITVKYKNKKVTIGIKYSTSNKKIATVKKGKIIASKKGTATISVKYKNKTCRFKVTVKNASLNLSQKSLSLKKGKTYTFKAYANKTKLKATSVKWTTSNRKIVSVNKNGTIKALKNGKAVITAKTSFGTAKCRVTVSSKPHQHTWVDHTATKQVPRTVHHDAVYETVNIPAVTKHQIQCLGCGQWFDSLDELEWHQVVDTNGECGNYDGHCERDVVITPAHTEQKLVKEAYDETVYDTQTYIDYQECTGCHEHRQK